MMTHREIALTIRSLKARGGNWNMADFEEAAKSAIELEAANRAMGIYMPLGLSNDADPQAPLRQSEIDNLAWLDRNLAKGTSNG